MKLFGHKGTQQVARPGKIPGSCSGFSVSPNDPINARALSLVPAITHFRSGLWLGAARCLACSRRSDRGDSAKRCEQKKQTTRGWGRGESEGLSLSLFSSSFFFSLSSFAPHSTIRTPGIGYLVPLVRLWSLTQGWYTIFLYKH